MKLMPKNQAIAIKSFNELLLLRTWVVLFRSRVIAMQGNQKVAFLISFAQLKNILIPPFFEGRSSSRPPWLLPSLLRSRLDEFPNLARKQLIYCDTFAI